MLQITRLGIGYASELVMNAKGLADSLRTISPNPQVCDYLATTRIYPSSGMALLGLMFYDMALGDKKELQKRMLVGRTASRLTLLTDIVDDIIDQRPSSITEKFDFLDKTKTDLFGYTAHGSEDIEEEACYVLARAIYDDFLMYDHEKKIESIFDELVYIIKRQFFETDTENLLKTAKSIGSCGLDSVAVLTEISAGKEYPKIREAARKIGEYGELLDCYYELDEDLMEGANTYATSRIRHEGDSPALRKEIRRDLLYLADQSINEGFSCLSDSYQKNIYKVLKAMIDVKYKVVEQFNQNYMKKYQKISSADRKFQSA